MQFSHVLWYIWQPYLKQVLIDRGRFVRINLWEFGQCVHLNVILQHRTFSAVGHSLWNGLSLVLLSFQKVHSDASFYAHLKTVHFLSSSIEMALFKSLKW